MEATVTIIAVGAYAERQYQKQDGEERHENAFYITDLQTL